MPSPPFPVLQGVRQGGVLSTWIYLLFINKLLCDLEDSPHGSFIGDMKTGNPTLADDLTLVSINRPSLQAQINIVTTYAHTWGYKLNESKCAYVIFGERKCNNDTVMINESILRSSESATHVGIVLHKSFKCSSAVDARARKGRSSIFFFYDNS